MGTEQTRKQAHTGGDEPRESDGETGPGDPRIPCFSPSRPSPPRRGAGEAAPLLQQGSWGSLQLPQPPPPRPLAVQLVPWWNPRTRRPHLPGQCWLPDQSLGVRREPRVQGSGGLSAQPPKANQGRGCARVSRQASYAPAPIQGPTGVRCVSRALLEP